MVPRRVRLRRLALLIPLVLLGAVLLVRARLPHPQMEGDKWLWEQAESATMLDVIGDFGSFDKNFKVGLFGTAHIEITDRQGIREVLRAFQGTPAFKSVTVQGFQDSGKPLIGIYVARSLKDESVELSEKWDSYVLDNGHGIAMTNKASVKRFLQAVREVTNRARRHQPGYAVHGQMR